MTNSQIEVLKIALLNVEREELRLLDSLPDENYEFSDEHKSRMKRMVDKYDRSNKTMPKRLSIILVAAILTITLIMSISAIRISVVNFFVEIYESFISIFVDSDATDDTAKIQEIYTPKYIPEQYNISKNFSDDYNMQTTLKNEVDNSEIIINQRKLSSLQSYIDFENSDYTEKMIDQQKVYYMIRNNTFMVIWCNEQYFFMLSCPETLGLEEIEKIICSMEVSQVN